MLRISNLVRGRILPITKVARAGLPNWERPDPPPSAYVPVDHELNDEQIMFTFFDRNMPEFILTQPEIYEGDTLLQALPNFLLGWGTLFLAAGGVALILYLGNPTKKYRSPPSIMVDRLNREKETVASREDLKWMNQNPMGIVVSSDMYARLGFANSISKYSKEVEQQDKLYTDINQQTKKYLQGLKQKAEKIVNDRHLAAQAHLNSHASQHSVGHTAEHPVDAAEHPVEHPVEHSVEHPIQHPVEQSSEQPSEQKQH